MNNHFKLLADDMPELRDYLTAHTTPEDPLLAELFRETYVKMHHPRRTSDHLAGLFLKMCCRMINPRYVLEIGTFTGYGALSMASALAPEAELHTIEKNDELENHLRQWFGRSPYGSRIQLHIGDALEIIPAMELAFDLVFIDGEKDQYPDYYRAVIEKVVPGGFILADNTLWSGKVVSGELPPGDRFTRGVQEFNDLVQSDPRVENLLLPAFDGVTMIRRKGN
ncbi:MAG: O-methyltransferase [Bacteroidales bacterium]